VNDRAREDRISARAARAGVPVAPELASAFDAYVDLLASWNRKINLTALPLDPVSDEAIDRLIVEPLIAARHVRVSDRLAIDIGSGGGSPAIPLRLAATSLRFVLVEVKSRKATFLRAVARELSLSNVEVENRSVADLLSRSELLAAADLVTMRAVKADESVLEPARELLQPAGRLFWFGAAGSGRELIGGGFRQQSLEGLPGGGELAILEQNIK
jgi:16S rRNA (guanine527-N7)-methyltransferase